MAESEPHFVFYKLLEEMNDFLQCFEWLHDFPMIKILSSNNIISKLPDDWKDWFLTNDYNVKKLLSSMYEGIDCVSLKNFLLKCDRYSIVSLLQTHSQTISYQSVMKEFCIDDSKTSKEILLESESLPLGSKLQPEIKNESKRIWKILRRVNTKKKHEIEKLAQFVSEIKQITHSDKVLDIGSGLGFLDLFLHLKYKYKLIGAESSEQKVESASKLRDKYLKDCSGVRYLSWHLNDDIDTVEKSKEIATELSSSSNSCSCFDNKSFSPTQSTGKGIDLLSLHSCADLSPIMLNIFMHNPHILSIVMMSCCYHKMTPSPEPSSEDKEHSCVENDKFKNFPLSKTLSEIMEKRNFRLKTFALRLASEESASHWQKRSENTLIDDVNSIAYRSILQNACDKNELKARKLRRHCAKKTLYASFEEYIDVVFTDFEFYMRNGEVFTDKILLRSHLKEEFARQRANIEFVGFVRALQLCLQPVLESLIILDRIVYLREGGFPKAGIIQLFDKVQSPRNNAIFAFRDT